MSSIEWLIKIKSLNKIHQYFCIHKWKTILNYRMSALYKCDKCKKISWDWNINKIK